ncbi:response regulator [Cryomorphaceae bacterium]|nr:response regulator [Cryomorphaceae bacterium]
MSKIMIVDDEPNILMSLDYMLRKERYDTLIARNGTEAMDLLQTEVPDLVVLDIMMPDVNGYEICEYIKSTKTFDQTKVIFLSAKSKRADLEKGLALGADAYMLKPFSTRELLKEIKNQLS